MLGSNIGYENGKYKFPHHHSRTVDPTVRTIWTFLSISFIFQSELFRKHLTITIIIPIIYKTNKITIIITYSFLQFLIYYIIKSIPATPI